MQPRIEMITEKKLIGQRLIMSLSEFKAGTLWKSFMPRRKEIHHPLNSDLVSVAVYPSTYFTDFKPTHEFEKWAAVEVMDFDVVPHQMETFVLPGGLYAVFPYKGSSEDPAIFQYIFGTWLPQSGYLLDNRPHFEVLGAKYKNNDTASEEEIWIPIVKPPGHIGEGDMKN